VSEPALDFESLTRRGSEALQKGLLDEAGLWWDQALVWARAHGDAPTADRAFCSCAILAIERGRGEALLGELREVLLRSSAGPAGFHAAYAIARAHDLRREREKARFYAGIALERAERIGNREWRAWVHNLLGNLELSASRFAEAAARFRQALQLAPATSSPVWAALIKDNLGYCCVIRRRRRAGLKLIYESLRTLRRHGAERFEVHPRLSLSYALLEAGRPRTATRHARRVLLISATSGDAEARKAALFLLGEAAKHLGRLDDARGYFLQLQSEFYPDGSHLPDLLMAIDVRRLVNLKS
jgi:tetratricopeptide (TPR) repeat protein